MCEFVYWTNELEISTSTAVATNIWIMTVSSLWQQLASLMAPNSLGPELEHIPTDSDLELGSNRNPSVPSPLNTDPIAKRILFVVYLTLSASQTIEESNVGWIDGLERIRKEAVVA
jgi:hypothetical protein